MLNNLPSEFVSHSGHHFDLSSFKDRRVAVIGGGASAIDIASLLKNSGAEPQVIARQKKLEFHSPPGPIPSRWAQLLTPKSGLGWGWQSRFYYDGAAIFRLLPRALRQRLVRRAYGPSGGYFMYDKIMGRVQLFLDTTVERAEVRNNEVYLQLRTSDGSSQLIMTDHVIAATGYKVDLRRLPFLNPEIKAQLKHADHSPIISGSSQSSIRGLYFIGPVTANTFGPVMRFACGARFTSPLLARAIGRSLVQN